VTRVTCNALPPTLYSTLAPYRKSSDFWVTTLSVSFNNNGLNCQILSYVPLRIIRLYS